MANPLTVVVQVTAPRRGAVSQPSLAFTPAECHCTWSWGLQPATALIDWVSATAQPAIVPGAEMRIDIAGGFGNGGHTFYGICLSVVPVLGTDGISQMQEFQDNRIMLQWDKVEAMFNVKDHRIVNGQFVRRYKHILPEDMVTLRETYTDAPYTAAEILDLLFDENPNTETVWERSYHLFLNNPVYDLDYTSGRKLGQVLLELSEALGLVFTLQGGPYRLVWCVKGVGQLPTPPANSDNRRGGRAMSQNPTRIEVLGDRNCYQVLNVNMRPDWLASWEVFWDFNLFVQDIFQNERTEAMFGSIPADTSYTSIDAGNDNNAGYMLARARAQTITVEQYARLRDRRDGKGNAFRDYRKFQNRSRLQMPVFLYLSNLMFKAFRFPNDFTFRNTRGDLIGLTSVQLSDRGLAQVTHDPATGVMSYTPGLSSQPNGYAIAQGYSVASDAFKSLDPRYFNVNHWLSTQAVWQSLPFQLDNSGEGDQFILFDAPVINTADLIQMDLTGKYPVLNAHAVVTSPPVRVGLTFLAERFSLVEYTVDGAVYGNFRDEVENVGGLNGEYVLTSPQATPFELAYADGETARTKAVELATPLLNGQLYYDYGGWVTRGCNGQQLTSMIDRVTVRVSVSGLEEEVEYTNERSRNIMVTSDARGSRVSLVLQPEREFDRVAQLAPLMAGQAELRDQANQLRSEAAFLLRHPGVSRNLMETFHRLLGLDATPDVVHVTNGTGTLPAGTPLWRESTGKNATLPNNAAPATLSVPVFMGVTVVDAEPATGPVRVTHTGQGNVILARVKGPVGVGDAVGATDSGQATNYLQTSPKTTIGHCQEAWGTSDVRLAQVQVGGGGGGSGSNFQGVYVPGQVYNENDEVVIQTGAGAGSYVSTADGNANSPLTGINWVQVGWLPQWF